MGSVVCTLFEGHYHYGVAALVNSLYRQGYRGEIYAGYRGELPGWSKVGAVRSPFKWEGAFTFSVASDLRIHFLPLNTNYHLTNYKPDFMIQIMEELGQDKSGIFYFDPDIVVNAPWTFFEEWIGCGVALCEDVNSPLPENHPRRIAWRRYFGKSGIGLKFEDPIYVNGGFVGVSRSNYSFVSTWKNLQEIMGVAIGGLNRSAFTTGVPLHSDAQGPFAPFGKTDQDALNATVEAWEGEVSFIGQEGMAFIAGEPVMPHALGQPKPWQWNPITQAVLGFPPKRVIQDYWKVVSGPIVTRSAASIRRRKLALGVASLIGRFYRRS